MRGFVLSIQDLPIVTGWGGGRTLFEAGIDSSDQKPIQYSPVEMGPRQATTNLKKGEQKEH